MQLFQQHYCAPNKFALGTVFDDFSSVAHRLGDDLHNWNSPLISLSEPHTLGNLIDWRGFHFLFLAIDPFVIGDGTGVLIFHLNLSQHYIIILV